MMGYSLQAQTQSGRILRLALVALVFAAIVILLARLKSPIFILFVQFWPFILMAALFIAYVSWSARRSPAEAASAADGAEKPKRGESLAELMSILNDEDIDDLRARVKLRLEEQIDSADAAEMETFADLLAEAKRKRGS